MLGAPIVVGPAPTGVVVSGDGTRVYVANGDDTVSVIDTASNTVVGSVVADPLAESGAHDIALSADGTRIFVTDLKDRVLRVLSVAGADITAPTVSVSAPSGSVSGVVSLSATASDNVGVVGVQFLVDSVAVGAEDTTSPYAVSFDTRTVSNGTHTVTALARDIAGNTTMSAPVTITVANTATNQAPVVPGKTIPGGPDPVTGIVTGRINVQDPDGNSLAYTLASPPSQGGTVTFDQPTGVFTYTPSQVARDQAARTSGLDYDTFGVSVSDGIATAQTVRESSGGADAPRDADGDQRTGHRGKRSKWGRDRGRLRLRHQL